MTDDDVRHERIVVVDGRQVAVVEPFRVRGITGSPERCLVFVLVEQALHRGGLALRTVEPKGNGFYMQFTRDELPGACRALESMRFYFSWPMGIGEMIQEAVERP